MNEPGAEAVHDRPENGVCGHFAAISSGTVAEKCEKGDLCRDRPSAKCCPAASYSPTTSRLQYHRRWQA